MTSSARIAARVALSVALVAALLGGRARGDVTYAWGYNGGGQFGNGTVSVTNSRPVAIAGSLAGVAQIDGGSNYTLALTGSGQVDAAGVNGFGQLGNGTAGGSSTTFTTAVNLPSTVVSISTGSDHNLALTSSGQAYAWGNNANGQLGTTTSPTDLNGTPAPVIGLSGTPLAAVAAGGGFSIGLTRLGQVEAWGYNGQGQLGTGNFANSYTPTAVTGLSGVTIAAISAGLHVLALSNTGQVYGWGLNQFGEVGNGTTSVINTPTLVSGFSGLTITAIAAGLNHSLALDSTGHVWAWGTNGNGALGIGTGSGLSDVPVLVPGLSHITAISAGSNDSFALASDGTLYAWGSNSSGQLGLGTVLDQLSPLALAGYRFSSIVADPFAATTYATGAAVPEPSALLSGLIGLPGLVLIARRASMSRLRPGRPGP